MKWQTAYKRRIYAMARAVIITSYIEHPLDIPGLLQPEDHIVCLDGGYDIAQRLGIHPDLVLGDFDSLQEGSLPDGDRAEGALSENGPTNGDRMEGSLPEGDRMNGDLPDGNSHDGSLPDGGSGRNPRILRYPPEKDYTDLELALRILDPQRTPEILVIGGLGGRLDQTLINVQMLASYTASPAAWDDLCRRGQEFRDPEKEPFGTERKYRRITLVDGHHTCFAVHGDLDSPADAPVIDDAAGSGGVSAAPDVDGAAEASDRRLVRGSCENRVVYPIPFQRGCYLSLLPLTDRCSGVTLEGVRYPLRDAVLRRGASLSISNEFLEAGEKEDAPQAGAGGAAGSSPQPDPRGSAPQSALRNSSPQPALGGSFPGGCVLPQEAGYCPEGALLEVRHGSLLVVVTQGNDRDQLGRSSAAAGSAHR